MEDDARRRPGAGGGRRTGDPGWSGSRKRPRGASRFYAGGAAFAGWLPGRTGTRARVGTPSFFPRVEKKTSDGLLKFYFPVAPPRWISIVENLQSVRKTSCSFSKCI